MPQLVVSAAPWLMLVGAASCVGLLVLRDKNAELALCAMPVFIGGAVLAFISGDAILAFLLQ